MPPDSVPNSPAAWSLVTLVFFALVLSRYLLVAGVFFWYFYLFRPQRWQHRKLNDQPHPPRQFAREIGWSALTSLIFAVVGAALAWAWQRGYVPIYAHLTATDWVYAPLSLLLALGVQDTYYYWLHRAMHHPRIYRLVHRVHHDSRITSPWTSFSFHPGEAVLQALIFPLIVYLIPMHTTTVVTFLTLMTLTSAINHLDVEVYPARFGQHWLGKWLIGATHHSLHHRQFRFNYGLYFTCWDGWMRTESPLFQRLFAQKTEVRQPAAPPGEATAAQPV